MEREMKNHNSCCQDSASQKILYRDPVCGMTTEDEKAYLKFVYQCKPYYFCSPHCLAKFKADPERYIQGEALPPLVISSPEEVSKDSACGKYTCPMHPEVLRDKPGSCPKCGMALEPMLPMVAPHFQAATTEP